MKSTSLLLILVLLSTLTSIAIAAAPTESCNSTHTLSDKQWQQVSLPCVPKGSGSVADVFGDDIVDAFGASTPSYGTNWVVYKYDLADNGYIKLAETDTLNVGVGYWIIQQSGNDATLDLPANSSPASAIQSDACPSDAGCFEIPLKTKTGAVGWNMIGRPSHFSSTLGDTRIHADTDACSGGCDLDTANSVDVFHNQLWTYSVLNYTSVNSPDGTLEPWVGYWAATLQSADGKAPKLLVPKVDAPPVADNPLSGRVTATTGVALSGVTVKVLQNDVEQSTTTTTNAEGKFGLPLNAASEYTLTFSAPGYANQVQRVKTSVVGDEVNIDVVLTPRGEQQTVPDSTSVTLTGSDGATVSLNPQFVDPQGNAVNASDGIKLTITPVDVSTPAGVAAFPGDFAGVPEGQSEASPIVSYGTVEYQFTRTSDGEELQLKAGEQADIQIPIYTKKHQDGTAIKAGDTIPLWSLNETTGLWTQEGTGTVVASASSPTGFALQAAVSHFSWWNCDVTMNPANAIVTVTAPEAGTALIKARTDADIGWRPNTVDTVISVGEATQPLPIPSNGEVCFWAEVNFTSGNNATTPESCVTAQPNSTVNVNLEIAGGTLGLVASPNDKIKAYINTGAVQTKIQPTTSESKVDYILESGSLPAGVTLSTMNDTSAVISGVPTEAGIFDLIIKGTDADENTATLTLKFTVIDGIEPPNLRTGFIKSDGSFLHYSNASSIRTYGSWGGKPTDEFDFSSANDGGEITSWDIDFDETRPVEFDEIVINDSGYFFYPKGSIPGDEFDISINPNTGVVSVIWPMSYIDDVPYRLDIEALEATLTVSNASGSSTRKISMVKSNGNRASERPHNSSGIAETINVGDGQKVCLKPSGGTCPISK